MATKKKKVANPKEVSELEASTSTPAKKGLCFNCEKECTDDDYCHGCRKFVCGTCGINLDVRWGGHDPEDHLNEPSEE